MVAYVTRAITRAYSNRIGSSSGGNNNNNNDNRSVRSSTSWWKWCNYGYVDVGIGTVGCGRSNSLCCCCCCSWLDTDGILLDSHEHIRDSEKHHDTVCEAHDKNTQHNTTHNHTREFSPTRFERHQVAECGGRISMVWQKFVRSPG